MEHVLKVVNEKLANNELTINYLRGENAKLTEQNMRLNETIMRLEIRIEELETAKKLEAEKEDKKGASQNA